MRYFFFNTLQRESVSDSDVHRGCIYGESIHSPFSNSKQTNKDRCNVFYKKSRLEEKCIFLVEVNNYDWSKVCINFQLEHAVTLEGKADNRAIKITVLVLRLSDAF